MNIDKQTQSCFCPHPGRAAFKIAAIVAAFVLAIFLLIWSVDDKALDQIKFDLSLWSLIALVLIINLVSLASFAALYVAYRWVRCDLKPPRVEDLPDQDANAR